MATIICRPGFCQACYDAHRPHRDSIFLAYCSHRQKYCAKTSTRSGVIGFTPHIFILHTVTRDNICVVDKICSMHGCGVGERPSKNGGFLYGAIPDKWETTYMSIKDWNALLLLMKRDPQYHL